MIIDGRAIAQEIIENVKRKVSVFDREIILRAIVMQPNAATESYLRVKAARASDAGIKMEIVHIPNNATDGEILTAVTASGADSVIVQLPLPEEINSARILDGIPFEKDPDVLSKVAYEHFTQGRSDSLVPPVVGAIQEVFKRANVEVAGRNAVVIGKGRLVGQPAIVWLESQGAQVEVLTRKSTDYSPLLSADIIISGAGSSHFITPSMLKHGVVLIDAGTSESNGAIAGDADPSCAEVASIFTPVPGGMGPIAVACLFKNTATLALRAE